MRWLRTSVFWLIAAALVVAFAAALLPFVPTRWWAVRLLDFPRLPFGIATLVLLALLPFAAGRRPRAAMVLGAAGVVAVGADAAVLRPYIGWGAAPAVAADACPGERRLSVMIANVLLTN